MAFQKIMNKEGYASYTECTVGLEPKTEGPVVLDIYKELFDTRQLTNRISIGLILHSTI
jgi:hypothetical protein